MRAVTAEVLATNRSERATTILKANWPDDCEAERIVRAATGPIETNDLRSVALVPVRVLPQLALDAAPSRLLGLAPQFDLGASPAIRLASIRTSGRPQAVFVGETQAAPVVQLNTSGAMLGPA